MGVKNCQHYPGRRNAKKKVNSPTRQENVSQSLLSLDGHDRSHLTMAQKIRPNINGLVRLVISWLPRQASSARCRFNIQLNNNPNAQNSPGGRSPCMNAPFRSIRTHKFAYPSTSTTPDLSYSSHALSSPEANWTIKTDRVFVVEAIKARNFHLLSKISDRRLDLISSVGTMVPNRRTPSTMGYCPFWGAA